MMMVFGWLLMIVFWAALILLAVWLVKVLFQNGERPSRSTKTGRQILDERFARGELTHEQYEEMKGDLV